MLNMEAGPGRSLWSGTHNLKEQTMKVSFPAMRGRIGQRTYYSCMMSLSVIPKMFTFRDWRNSGPEDREQRILNEKRVPEIGRYILENEEGISLLDYGIVQMVM